MQEECETDQGRETGDERNGALHGVHGDESGGAEAHGPQSGHTCVHTLAAVSPVVEEIGIGLHQ